MLTPGIDSEFTFPPQLKQRLLEWFPDYFPVPNRHESDPKKLFDAICRYTKQQKDVAIRLLREYPLNLFAMVFIGPDRLQHFLWTDPQGGEKSILLDYYQFLGTKLWKRFWIRCPDQALVLLVF